MQNKYYQPEIGEFYVGFECEWQCKLRNETWNKQVCDVDLINIAYDAIEHADEEEPFEEQFRVKFLDEQDILDLGFEHTNNKRDLLKGNIRIRLYVGKEFKIPNVCIYIHDYTVFKGEIKNKSELKKILKMLE